ncbi:TetR/AcrR family transcriptional regulator [Cohnella abietis]|uniref:TetR family transcriptional regulator n=1 Tax=Cohnella abietis TaxID=2507935 RepID=A0A3T1CXR8_9BACL|nr:TetR/AcrR family transcriptional regulator [Cohnella abietis]BBI30620.1 TetR family transcriptional regulator [Cohnella abietis]
MQILKDEVRNKIMKAALLEFKREGYLKSSMRQIAQVAGITSGNIYRYFTNKEQLFDAIVQPVNDQYTSHVYAIGQKVASSQAQDTTNKLFYFYNIELTIIELFKNYSEEFMILLNRSEGSKYESAKSDLVNLAYGILERVFSRAKGLNRLTSVEDTALARMLSSTIVEGLCLILRENDEGDTLKKLIDQLLTVYTEGINKLIKQM